MFRYTSSPSSVRILSPPAAHSALSHFTLQAEPRPLWLIALEGLAGWLRKVSSNCGLRLLSVDASSLTRAQ